jgi:sugar phosphate isomerase/epimerase
MATPAAEWWPLGCQTRPWLQRWGGEELTARLPGVMRALATIGYAGFETRLACLPLRDPDAFAAMRARAGGIALAGAHIVGTFWEPGSEAAIPGMVADAAALPALGCDRAVVSAVPIPAPLPTADLRRLTENLSALGHELRSVGVRLVYHNHAAEIADDARICAAIVAACAPEDVMLGADLGWVAHAGMQVPEFIARFGARLAYAHVRDVTAIGGGGFTEVGRGVLNYGAIFAALDAADYRGWLVAESEFGPNWHGADDIEATVAAQLTGLRATLAAYI